MLRSESLNGAPKDASEVKIKEVEPALAEDFSGAGDGDCGGFGATCGVSTIPAA
jgi:hypothetical protein